MKLTRQHFVFVAGVLRELHTDYGDQVPFIKLVRRFGTALQATNPQFNRERFEWAAGLRGEDFQYESPYIVRTLHGGYEWATDLGLITAKTAEDGAIVVRIVDDMTNPERKPVELLLDRQRAEVLIELLKLTTA